MHIKSGSESSTYMHDDCFLAEMSPGKDASHVSLDDDSSLLGDEKQMENVNFCVLFYVF